MPTQAGVETVGGHHPVATQTFACSSRAGVRSSRSAHTLEKKQLCRKTQTGDLWLCGLRVAVHFAVSGDDAASIVRAWSDFF